MLLFGEELEKAFGNSDKRSAKRQKANQGNKNNRRTSWRWEHTGKNWERKAQQKAIEGRWSEAAKLQVWKKTEKQMLKVKEDKLKR